MTPTIIMKYPEQFVTESKPELEIAPERLKANKLTNNTNRS